MKKGNEVLDQGIDKYDKSGNNMTSIKVACHNINRIKNNRIKLKTIVE